MYSTYMLSYNRNSTATIEGLHYSTIYFSLHS